MAKLPEGYSAFVEAAEVARANREIGPLEYWRLRIALRREDCCAQAREIVLHEAEVSGKPVPHGDNGAIDWDALIAFIKELIPLIMQLISLF